MPWHQHTRRCWEDLNTVWNCTNCMSNTITCLLLNSEDGLAWTSWFCLSQVWRCVSQVSCVCSTSIAPLPRATVSGIRASNFGDIIFVGHAEIMLRSNKYMVLLVLDGATNLLWLRHNPHLTTKRQSNVWSVGPMRPLVCLRPLSAMKPFSKKTFWLTTELMVSRNVLVVREHHGQTELKQLLDFSNDNGNSWPRVWKMIDSKELPLEKLSSVLFGPETLNSPLVVTHLWKLPLVEDHLVFLTLKQLTQLRWVLNLYLRTGLNRNCKSWHWRHIRKQDSQQTFDMTWPNVLCHQMDLRARWQGLCLVCSS